MIEKTLRANLLYDFYGNLLTEKQRKIIEMYYEYDMSLAEISEETGISRQAVHDALKRTELALEEYEGKLQLVEKYQRLNEKAAKLKKAVSSILHDSHSLEQTEVLLHKEIDKFISDEF